MLHSLGAGTGYNLVPIVQPGHMELHVLPTKEGNECRGQCRSTAVV